MNVSQAPDLNAEVTAAVHKAEHAVFEAYKAYKHLADVEERLSNAESDELLRDTAMRGSWTAGLVRDVLRSLVRRDFLAENERVPLSTSSHD